MFIILLIFSFSRSKRYEKIDNDEDMNNNQNSHSRRKYKHPSKGSEHQESDDEPEEQPGEPENPLRSTFPNTIIKNDGTRICEEGFLSDSIIDSRGCWKCIEECSKNSFCDYPGICFVPVPLITNVIFQKNLNNSLDLLINYLTNKPNFNPIEAYCLIDKITLPSIKINQKEILCPLISNNISSLSISFDTLSWSPIFTNFSSLYQQKLKIPSISINFIGIIFLILGLIFLPIILCKNRTSSPKKYKETRPMAYFPMVDDKNEKNIPHY